MSQFIAKESATPPDEPMRSVHTNNFPEILRQLNISLVVSTYQTGKVKVIPCLARLN
ncbi:hypothetical protein IQ255_18100 [Pleurocapsales cyanobacterium LEGE 10410]|nr:hypothetical protein [Pleurocapsales cyanobacterium LEGE 10410]